jgi:predicted TIM-barrel fold metal-dependent hydrolase
MTDTLTRIRAIVDETPIIDTHEHLIEESMRVRGDLGMQFFPCDDWAALFLHYAGDDLHVSGMAPADMERFRSPDCDWRDKLALMKPYWERIRHTGYGQAVLYTLRDLYGIRDLDEQTVGPLQERYRDTIKPGFYEEILRRRCRILHCQVNSVERIFMETEQPDLLKQDIHMPPLSTDLDLERVEREFSMSADTLDGWLDVVDRIFAECGSKAIAVKNPTAYGRRLKFEDATAEEAAPLFRRVAAGEEMGRDERKPLEDFLFRHCVRRATEHGLPVKLHTGYYAGHDGMPLDRVRRNAGDLCSLLREFPDTRFVLMHIGYPYEAEFIALAKQYANAWIDMCWAWIMNPAACVRFLKEFIVTAPANKVLVFGGDYVPVENVYGHCKIARRGIALAISELIGDGWLAEEEAPALIAQLMHGNAEALFCT